MLHKNNMDKKERKDKYKTTLFNFNNNFDLNNDSDVEFLINLFDRFAENIYIPSGYYKNCIKEMVKVDDELQNTLSSKQKELLEKRDLIENKMCGEENEQAFIYGFAMANEINKETKKVVK